MKLHFLNPKIFFLTSITITYNPSLKLSSSLNNFNILPIYNSQILQNELQSKQIPIQYISQTLLTTFPPLTTLLSPIHFKIITRISNFHVQYFSLLIDHNCFPIPSPFTQHLDYVRHSKPFTILPSRNQVNPRIYPL